MEITIAGTGYVGLVAAAVFAHVGHNVTCVDINREKIERLNQGENVIYEPGLSEMIQENKLRLNFTTDYVHAYKNTQVIFIAVGTPEKVDGSANLKYVYNVVDQIIENVNSDCIVVLKSTVPVGTNDRIQQYINKNKKKSINIEIVSNPEFLAQGTALNDMLYNNRIVIGAESDNAKKIMRGVYKKLDLPMLFTDRCSSEMIKYASNDFLALKISYINEIANLCEILGANIEDVAIGMGMDDRIGNKFLRAGIGYGGSCFPKDTKALHWLSNYHDNEIKTIKAAVEVNANQKIRLIKKARNYYDNMEGLTAAVLGLAFKPGTDDLREAPSIDIVTILQDNGVKIKAWDPVASENFKKHFSDVEYCESIEETLVNADLCFILTEWPEIKSMDLNLFTRMKKPIVLDGRNCFDIVTICHYPVIYDSIGRRTVVTI